MKISYSNGNVYEGNLLAGVYEGKGKLTYHNSMGVYDGDWHCGQPHGKALRVYSDNAKYVGEFFEGK